MTARVVIIAAGSHIFQAAHIPALGVVDAEVVGVFDADLGRAETVGRANGWPFANDLDALLAMDADAAIICAPHPLHARLVDQCLRTGHDALIEKPLAPLLSEIDTIADAADETGRTVAVVHQHRFREEVREARRRISSGDLGRIHRAVVTASYPKRSAYYTETPWRGTWLGEGGGVLLNQGLHDIDLLVHLLGSPVRVTGSLRTLVHPIETEDSADLLAVWENGCTASVHITSAAGLGENRFEIWGSAGALRLTSRGLEARAADQDFDAFASEPGGHFDAFGGSDWDLVVAHGGGTHADVYADFFAARAESRPPATDPRGARAAVEVIAAAALASPDRTWIDLPLDARAQDAFVAERIAERATAEVGA